MPAEATETISYQMPAIRHNGVLVWYAAFSGHCSLFPTAAVMDKFKNELKGFKTSKGTVQFALDKPLPVALIKKDCEDSSGAERSQEGPSWVARLMEESQFPASLLFWSFEKRVEF